MPFRGTEAIACGVLTRAALRGPLFRRLFPDVYVSAEVEMDHHLRCAAALLYARGAGGVAISGLSAAAVWGVDLRAVGAPVEMTVPRGSGLRSKPGLQIVTSTLMKCEVASFTGITVTNGLRTAYDLARRLTRVEAVTALDALTHRTLVSLDELRSHATAIAGTGQRGSRRFVEAVRLCEPLAESPMESRSRLLLIDSGLPPPVVQFEVRDALGRFIARVDLAYPCRRIAIEYDGDYHRSRSVYQADVRRRNALLDAGWTVVTIVAAEFYRSPEQIVARIRKLLG